MKPFLCESEKHFEVTGTVDRVVSHPFDQVVVSLDFMRKDNQKRLHRVSLNDARTIDGRIIGPQRLCKACARDWVKNCHPAYGAQEALVW